MIWAHTVPLMSYASLLSSVNDDELAHNRCSDHHTVRGKKLPRFVDAQTLTSAVKALRGTAGVYFLNWLVYKQMGLQIGNSIEIDTSNSKDALERLFGYGSPDGRFYYPVAPSPRFLTYASDASRSVVQTNTRQWLDNTGTINPSGLFQIKESQDKRLRIGTQRSYPVGLGLGRDGLAHTEDSRVVVPEIAWAVWYGRQTEIPDDESPADYLVKSMRSDLNISVAEGASIFVNDGLAVTSAATRLDPSEIFRICSDSSSSKFENIVVYDTPQLNQERISILQTTSSGPSWLNVEPEELLKSLLAGGNKAILLTGPPRTGKTRAIRALVGDNARFIQIHDGWTYDSLVQGQTLVNGEFVWQDGPLLESIRKQDEFIVLDEINRTRISQSIGELFSLVESAYRGPEFSVTLRKAGDSVSVSPDTVFFFTMNTLDKSTEDIDDALFGRIRSVEFPPRVESLAKMLEDASVDGETRTGLLSFFAGVQDYYPLGHGYFAEFRGDTEPVEYYLSAIRPVLANHFESFDPHTLAAIDTLFDECVVESYE